MYDFMQCNADVLDLPPPPPHVRMNDEILSVPLSGVLRHNKTSVFLLGQSSLNVIIMTGIITVECQYKDRDYCATCMWAMFVA